MGKRRSPRHGFVATLLVGALALGTPSAMWAGESRRDTVTEPPRAAATRVRPGHRHEGIASYYGGRFHGRKTASGEIFDQHKLTAAHRTLPLGTRVKVTDNETGRAVVVRVNDRGPYVKGRVIDLSRRAGEVLGITEEGLAHVTVEVIAPANV